jgi:murein DD-endopeptidase MepM/ murein hydrolase activator NlpD
VDPDQRASARPVAAACAETAAPACPDAVADRPFRPSPSRSSPALRLGARPRAALVVGLLVLPAPAGARAATPHGTAAPASPPAAAPPAPPPSVATAAAGRPSVDAVTCRTGCLGLATARAGSVVRVAGEGVGGAASVVFLGHRGPRDDRVAAAHPVGPAAAEATLPAGAHGGPVRVLTTDGRRSERSDREVQVRSGHGDDDLDARVATRKAFVDAANPATLDVFVGGSATAEVVVDLVRPADGGVIAHWALPAVPGGTVQSVDWDGTAGGADQPEGRYVFRVSSTTTTIRAAQAAGAAPGGPAAPIHASSFVLLRNRFPILGPHRYGTGAARYGAGRAGHTHRGQDVFADCGTPLVAAHGGTVEDAGYQGAAGNYLVIATGDGPDEVYMHLRDPALVAEDAAVVTGQPIGFVGDTGDAVGCHLHFEMWRGGRQSGGAPEDPLPSLTAWDAAD